MHQFNQTYAAIIESTRRDFLKQATGAIGAVAANTHAVSEIPAAPIAKKAIARMLPFRHHIAYDITDSTDSYTLSDTIKRYFGGKELSRDQLKSRVQQMQIKLDSKKFNAKTLKQLIATSESTMERFIDDYYNHLNAAIANINYNIPEKVRKQTIANANHDHVYKMYYNMVEEFMRNENDDLFNYLYPHQILRDKDIIMPAHETNDIFKSGATVEKMFRTMPDLKYHAQQLTRKIEKQQPDYSKESIYKDHPMDYKGGWQHDADYQSLSMGESTIAENNIHDAVRPGILKRQTSGKLTCTKARALKSKQSNKGNNTAKAAQRYINYHC